MILNELRILSHTVSTIDRAFLISHFICIRAHSFALFANEHWLCLFFPFRIDIIVKWLTHTHTHTHTTRSIYKYTHIFACVYFSDNTHGKVFACISVCISVILISLPSRSGSQPFGKHERGKTIGIFN